MMPYTANLMEPSLPHFGTIQSPFVVGGAVAAGLLFGSFLNVCIARLPLHRSIAWPGSHCPRCQAPILVRDNIPLLSWVILRGRCRACGERISRRYPAVELATALLFLLSILAFGLSVDGLSAAVFCFLMLGLLVMDAETMLLPDTFTLPGIALGLAHAALVAAPGTNRLTEAGGSLLAAALGGLSVLVIRWTYWLVRRRHGMGLGDAKLVAMIAAWLGLAPTLLVFVLAVTAGALVGIGAAVRRPRGAAPWQTLPLPLGAFLSGAAIVVLFTGQRIIDWYMGLFP